MLDRDRERRVIDAGWRELHPYHHRGVKEIPVYAPRDVDELATVKVIVNACHGHVMQSAGGVR